MLQETELIVLDAVRYSDTAAIVHTYSRAFGPLPLKVARTSRRKAGGTRPFFTPFSLLSVTLDFRPKKEIQTPWEARLVTCPSCVSTDPVANAVTLFLTEVLFRLLRNEEPDEALFALLKDEIAAIDGLSTSELANFHLVFLLKLLPTLGILPVLESYRQGYVLNFEEGRFFPAQNAAQRADAECSAMLFGMITAPEPYSYPLTRETRKAFLGFLTRYLSHHFPSVRDLRSPDVLSALFAG